MFTSKQIYTATALIKNFAKIAQELSDYPQALLIMQKGKKPLVLVDVEIYEGLLHRAYNPIGVRESEDDYYEVEDDFMAEWKADDDS